MLLRQSPAPQQCAPRRLTPQGMVNCPGTLKRIDSPLLYSPRIMLKVTHTCTGVHRLADSISDCVCGRQCQTVSVSPRPKATLARASYLIRAVGVRDGQFHAVTSRFSSVFLALLPTGGSLSLCGIQLHIDLPHLFILCCAHGWVIVALISIKGE